VRRAASGAARVGSVSNRPRSLSRAHSDLARRGMGAGDPTVVPGAARLRRPARRAGAACASIATASSAWRAFEARSARQNSALGNAPTTGGLCCLRQRLSHDLVPDPPDKPRAPDQGKPEPAVHVATARPRCDRAAPRARRDRAALGEHGLHRADQCQLLDPGRLELGELGGILVREHTPLSFDRGRPWLRPRSRGWRERAVVCTGCAAKGLVGCYAAPSLRSVGSAGEVIVRREGAPGDARCRPSLSRATQFWDAAESPPRALGRSRSEC
jgi:hypothetical protein